MNHAQELELLDEVLFSLNDTPLARVDAVLDTCVTNVAHKLSITLTAEDARVIAALAYEQLVAAAS
jgi:hypothetical protein